MSQITQIEAWAMQIAGCDNPIDHKVRAQIVEWSRFTAKDNGKEITIGQKTLAQISPGWLLSIYRRGKKEYEKWLKTSDPSDTLPLFEETPPAPKKRARKPTETRMPVDGPYNHFEGEPF